MSSFLRILIFDFGNVILPLTPQRCLEAFNTLSRGRIQNQIVDDLRAMFENFEMNKVSEKEFANAVRFYGSIEVEDDAIFDAWNKLLGTIPQHRFQLLERLAEDYSLYMLSNTNGIHQRHFEEAVKKTQEGKTINDFFEHVYYSHQLGMRKPDEAIFTHVLQDCACQAGDVLFIDDHEENVLSASRLGMNTLHLQVFDQLEESLERILNLTVI